MKELRPNLVIIGAQKSASTYLHRMLSQHPMVFMSRGEDKSFEDPEYREFSLDALTRRVPYATQVYGIKRPNYLATPEVPGRIRRHLPDARICAILRNPTERAISAYYHYMKYGITPVHEPNRVLRKIFDPACHDMLPAYATIREYGLYHKYLSRYLDHFGSDRVLILLQEDVIIPERARETFRHLTEFLDISGTDFHFQPLKDRLQASIYNLTRLRIRSLKNRCVYRYDYARAKSYDIRPNDRNWFGSLLNRAIQAIDRRILKRVFPENRRQVTDATRQLISEFYREDVRKLSALTGRDLDSWL